MQRGLVSNKTVSEMGGKAGRPLKTIVISLNNGPKHFSANLRTFVRVKATE